MPSHMYPFSDKVSPDRPEPHPISNTSEPSEILSNSMAL